MEEAIAALREAEHVQEFEANHPNHYLANLFIPNYDNDTRELSYYNPDEDTMISVSSTGDISDEQDILRTEHEINELEVSKDTLQFDEALNHARSTFEHDEGFRRIMGVLQTRDNTEWNITFITNSFDVYNARLNASNGEILTTSEDDVMSWIQGTT